ncbi:MAG TPA: ABC transporter permease subunit [Kofleriaceae bacterium]|nr:ABC transporter permease subunit [Kofleriaceae bacterium]
MIVRGVARVALAWVLTYVLACALSELAPGPPAERAARAAARLPDDARGAEARRAIIATVERELELGGGAAARVARATGRAVTVDLDRSWRDRRPVGDIVAPGLASTGGRALCVLVLALALGLAAGLGGASLSGNGGARGTIAGGAVGFAVALALAMPTVWLCQLFLAATPAAAGSSALAVLALALAPAAVVAAHARASVDEMLASPLAAAVLARGASRTRLVWIHGARLAVPRLAPLAASTVGFALGAAAVVERALALPGAGRTLTVAAASGDVPVVAALSALAAATVAATGVLAQVVARVADPRLAEPPQ